MTIPKYNDMAIYYMFSDVPKVPHVSILWQRNNNVSNCTI